MKPQLRLTTLLLAAATLMSACYSRYDGLVPQRSEGVPGISDLGVLTPATITNQGDLLNSTIYGELGATGTVFQGGLTFSFVGTGGDVCIWVDPELAAWTPYVFGNSGVTVNQFSWPDNQFDDGDLDIRGGESVYYSGTQANDLDSESARIGNFEINSTDSLGTPILLNFDRCNSVVAGTGVVEDCTIGGTLEGALHTVVLETFSLPIDDWRLSYGLVFAEGTCDEMLATLSEGAPVNELQRECVILGESIPAGEPTGSLAADAGLPTRTWTAGEVPTIEGSIDFETAYCGAQLYNYCQEEFNRVTANGNRCAWHEDPDPAEGLERCFCGDRTTLPEVLQ